MSSVVQFPPEGFRASEQVRRERREHRTYHDREGSKDFWEDRRRQRERLGEKGYHGFWPDSHSEEEEEMEIDIDRKSKKKRKKEKKEKKSKKSKKEKHKSRKHKDSKSKKKRHRRRSSSSESLSSSSSSEEEKRSKRRRHEDKNQKEEKKNDVDQSLDLVNQPLDEVNQCLDSEALSYVKELKEKRRLRLEEEGGNLSDSNEGCLGPLPKSESRLHEKDYGKALLPGEGAAMAAYIADGKRIPRRGEIGLTSQEILSFEDVGYVMSGSRHQRMEAVRIRKENQLYSADEKRALQMFNKEERGKRESKILSQFRDMVRAKTSEGGGGGGRREEGQSTSGSGR